MAETLLDEARAAAQEAFEEAASILRDVTYYVAGTETRDQNTGVVTQPATTLSGLKAIRSSYFGRKVDGERVRIGDLRLFFERRQIDAIASAAGVAIVPKVEDYLTIEGTRCEILDFVEDPAGATLEIHARRVT